MVKDMTVEASRGRRVSVPWTIFLAS